MSSLVLELLRNPIAADRYGVAASMMRTSFLRDRWVSFNDGTGENCAATRVLAWPAGTSGSFYRNCPAGWTEFTGAPKTP